MISIEPRSELYICRCPIENDNKNQLTFSNRESQINYFNSIIVRSTSNYTYIRTDDTVRVDIPIDEIINCNYLFYRNNRFTDRYYFCFITDMKYVSENSTLISFKTDVFQTWQFDINYRTCFVEREHVNNDGVGMHTLPEGLETGEYIINTINTIDDRANDTLICMGCSEVPSNFPVDVNNRIYGGIYSGLVYILFDSATECSKMIKAYDKEAKADAIYSIFLIPTSLSFTNKWYTGSLGDQTDIKFAIPEFSDSAISMVNEKTININTSLNGYTPKNNKLLCYPFNYLYITNNNGSDCTFNYEDFINNTPIFNVDGVITTGCSIKLYPLNYKKYENSTLPWKNSQFNYGMVGSKYPTCSWLSDSYTNWLTENAINLGVSGISNLSQIIAGGIATATGVGAGAGIPMLASGLAGVTSQVSSLYQHSLVPEQAKGNTNSGDVTMASEMMGFVYYQMSIKAEYAKIIDDYFSMFGYKVNSLKVPNIYGRKNWNFVKTIDCNFDGNFPQSDLQEIKNMFNSGITLWHSPDTMYDYSQNNSII